MASFGARAPCADRRVGACHGAAIGSSSAAPIGRSGASGRRRSRSASNGGPAPERPVGALARASTASAAQSATRHRAGVRGWWASVIRTRKIGYRGVAVLRDVHAKANAGLLAALDGAPVCRRKGETARRMRRPAATRLEWPRCTGAPRRRGSALGTALQSHSRPPTP